MYKSDTLGGKTPYLSQNNTIMRALKFYDKEGVGFELFMDYVKQSITLQVDNAEEPENSVFVEIDEADIDDIIISLVELKNELVSIRNIGNN